MKDEKLKTKRNTHKNCLKLCSLNHIHTQTNKETHENSLTHTHEMYIFVS